MEITNILSRTIAKGLGEEAWHFGKSQGLFPRFVENAITKYMIGFLLRIWRALPLRVHILGARLVRPRFRVAVAAMIFDSGDVFYCSNTPIENSSGESLREVWNIAKILKKQSFVSFAKRQGCKSAWKDC